MQPEFLLLGAFIGWPIGQILGYFFIQWEDKRRSRLWHKKYAAGFEARKQACSDIIALVDR
jgi:ABC-type sugar transport system permease subunit